MDSKKGWSEMLQMDAAATSKDTAAGKRKTKKRVPAMGKKAAKPNARKIDSTVKETRRRAPVHKLTIPVDDEDRDEFNESWMGTWGDLIVSMERKSILATNCMRFLIFFFFLQDGHFILPTWSGEVGRYYDRYQN